MLTGVGKNHWHCLQYLFLIRSVCSQTEFARHIYSYPGSMRWIVRLCSSQWSVYSGVFLIKTWTPWTTNTCSASLSITSAITQKILQEVYRSILQPQAQRLKLLNCQETRCWRERCCQSNQGSINFDRLLSVVIYKILLQIKTNTKSLFWDL